MSLNVYIQDMLRMSEQTAVALQVGLLLGPSSEGISIVLHLRRPTPTRNTTTRGGPI